jgi:hypothetical protein
MVTKFLSKADHFGGGLKMRIFKDIFITGFTVITANKNLSTLIQKNVNHK